MSADLLRLPVVGPFLRWKHARTALQSVMLVVAVLVVADGLFGPAFAPRNLAGSLPWVHWRGLVVVVLLLAGNLFCMACPFMLTRRIGKKLLPGDRPWPRVLKNKWLAVGILLVFFWAYEAFDLWESPWLTAWIIVTYFAGAFVIDGFFRGAAFCKHVCPIGQFNFVNSLVSPTEVRVRDADVCASCRTKDCIKGRYDDAGALLQNGCELWLFQQRKVGNMDCTFCMECIQACPYDNVGIEYRAPAVELAPDPWRSGIGRFGERPDLAALAMLITFGAYMNAFGMVSPVYALQDWMGSLLGTANEPILTALLFLVGLVTLPLLLVLGAGALTRWWAREGGSVVETATAYAWSLVPVGFGMWLAHYLFHFLVGGLTVVPLLVERASFLGLSGPPPSWATGTMVPEGWLLPLQLVFVEGGMLLSVWLAHRIAVRRHGRGRRALRALLPWAGLAVGLSLLGMWLLTQPMEMRGTALG